MCILHKHKKSLIISQIILKYANQIYRLAEFFFFTTGVLIKAFNIKKDTSDLTKYSSRIIIKNII